MIEEVWGEGLQTPSCLVFALWCRWQEFGPNKIADSDQPQSLRETRTRATGKVARASPPRLGLKPLKANERMADRREVKEDGLPEDNKKMYRVPGQRADG